MDFTFNVGSTYNFKMYRYWFANKTYDDYSIKIIEETSIHEIRQKYNEYILLDSSPLTDEIISFGQICYNVITNIYQKKNKKLYKGIINNDKIAILMIYDNDDIVIITDEYIKDAKKNTFVEDFSEQDAALFHIKNGAEN